MKQTTRTESMVCGTRMASCSVLERTTPFSRITESVTRTTKMYKVTKEAEDEETEAVAEEEQGRECVRQLTWFGNQKLTTLFFSFFYKKFDLL